MKILDADQTRSPLAFERLVPALRVVRVRALPGGLVEALPIAQALAEAPPRSSAAGASAAARAFNELHRSDPFSADRLAFTIARFAGPGTELVERIDSGFGARHVRVFGNPAGGLRNN